MIDPRLLHLQLASFNIPPKFRAVRLDNLTGRNNAQTTALDAAQDFVDTLSERYVSPQRPHEEYPAELGDIGKGILFYGPPGGGKTTIAAATLIEVYLRYGLDIYAVSMAEWISQKTNQFSFAKMDTPEGWARWNEIQVHTDALLNAPVIMIDDIGKEYKTSSGYAESAIDLLIRERNTHARPTILTSNLRVARWGNTYGPSMGSFVQEAFDLVDVSGEDQRG